MPSPNQSSRPSWKDITAPASTTLKPEESFRRETEQRLQAREQSISTQTVTDLTTGAGATDPRFTDIIKHNPATHTKTQYDALLRTFIEDYQRTAIATQSPLFSTTELQAHSATTGRTDLPNIESNLARIRDARIESAVDAAVRNAIKHHEEYAKLKDDRKKDNKRTDLASLMKELEAAGNPIDADKWVRHGINYMKPHDRLRLAETGLVSFPAGTDQDGNPYPAAQQTRSFSGLKLVKGLSTVCTLATIATVATAAGAALAGVSVFGFAAPVLWSCATGVGVVNLLAQKMLKLHHDNTMKATFKEIRSELDKTQPDGCVAWAGLLYKFVQEANPLWLAPNSSELFNSSKASKMPAILSHLRSAAAVAISEEHGITSYTKGMNYKDHLRLTNPSLDNLERRWNWWHDKQQMLAAWVAVGSGLATASLLSPVTAIP
jgi:hypothetical protein